ncbi:MAG: hypothetical protein M3068_12790 [Gemmatimonadota bacterium]|nr:hypothetical protein [Gemmatimonadota bacterium]
MLRFLAAMSAALCVVGSGVAAPSVSLAQGWNSARTLTLVQRATELRARQIADTALRDYQATAHGYLTFLAQLGTHAEHGQPAAELFTEPPRVVKADELALTVYWRAPNLSKQVIEGRRDSLLLPTDIQYHRDHLAIIQNNFPSIIRLGEGDEVADVPHPLSPVGLREYDYAIRDSLLITLPDRKLAVYEVRVRPKNDRGPRVIGAVYIDRETADVVRMAFNFTRAAFLDKDLDDLAIVLENGLVEGRFWLPTRQEVEIRRSGSWLDFPARGIIRGRWEICCYRVNAGLAASLFVGPEIVELPRRLMAQHRWSGQILDSLPPDVRAVTDADVQRVQREARELVRADALASTRGARLSARRVSDFVRVDRVEGLAGGGAAVVRLGAGRSLSLGGRYGRDDRQLKARAALSVQRASGVGVELYAERSYRNAGDFPERSLVINSVAAQEFGSDYTELFDARGGGVGLEIGALAGLRWRVDAAYFREAPLGVHAVPFAGRFAPTIPAARGGVRRAAVAIERPTALFWQGAELHWMAELRAASYGAIDSAGEALGRGRHDFGRFALSAELERPVPCGERLVTRTAFVAGSGGPVPAQDLAYLGGPVSAPGYDFHQFASRLAGSEHVEWRLRVPFPAIGLGRFGRAPGSALLAPFAHVVYVDDARSRRAGAQGWYPSVGLGGLLFFDLLRLDVARGLRAGRWSFSLDVTRELWGVL